MCKLYVSDLRGESRRTTTLNPMFSDPIAECRPRQKPVAIGNQYMRKTRLASLDINFPSCMTARCGTPGGCAMVKPSHCVPGNCKLQPMCLNQNGKTFDVFGLCEGWNVSACAFTSCLVGSDCVLQQVTCIRAPWYRILTLSDYGSSRQVSVIRLLNVNHAPETKNAAKTSCIRIVSLVAQISCVT